VKILLNVTADGPSVCCPETLELDVYTPAFSFASASGSKANPAPLQRIQLGLALAWATRVFEVQKDTG